MADVEATIDVDVPVSTAYDQWTQFEEFPQFMDGVLEVRQLDDTTTSWVAEIGGDRREWQAEIVEQEPDRVIAWRGTGEHEPSGRVTFEPADAGTRVSVVMSYEPDGMKESVGSMLGFDSRQVESDLERFKELIESRQTPTGAWRGEVRSGDVIEDDGTVL
jgi:uncharacterized membrane protein